MLGVLIADSDIKAAQALKTEIPWEAYGFSVQKVCSRMEDAEAAIKSGEIYVAIVADDPDFDGLSLLEAAKHRRQNIRFVVTSQRKVFDHAAKAVRLNAAAYLIKPVQPGELGSILEELSGYFDLQNLYRHIELFGFLNNIPKEANAPHSNTLPAPGVLYFDEGAYYYLAAMEEETDGKKANAKALYLSLQAYIGSDRTYTVIKANENEFGIVVSNEALKKKKIDIHSYAIELQRAFKKDGIFASIFIGKRVDSIYQIAQSKESILLLKKRKFYLGSGTVLSCEKTDHMVLSESAADPAILRNLQNAVINGSQKDVKKAVGVFCEAAKDALYTLEFLRLQLEALVSEFKKRIQLLKGDERRAHFTQILLEHLENSSIEAVQEALEAYCVEVNAYLRSLTKSDGTDVVNNMVEYVKSNYYENLDLPYFAKRYFINVSYLGQLFKKKTGISFNKFLNQVRIQEAKRILKNEKIRIYEVAQRVGYKDANYFCLKFEELVHTTPTKYRESGK